jgi:hypothetical protein
MPSERWPRIARAAVGVRAVPVTGKFFRVQVAAVLLRRLHAGLAVGPHDGVALRFGLVGCKAIVLGRAAKKGKS